MKLIRDILNLGSTVANAATVATSATVSAASSYASEWKEERQLEIAGNAFERDIKWMKLGQAIASTELDQEAIDLAKARYGK